VRRPDGGGGGAGGEDVRLEWEGGGGRSGGRARVAQVQEFDRVVFKKASGLRLEITRDDQIILGGAAANHPAVLGDELRGFLTALHAWLATHTHGDPPTTGAPTTVGPPPAAPQPIVPVNLTSAVVKLE